MGLPQFIARVEIPERGPGEESRYERFRALVLTGPEVYQNYTITKGGERGGYYDRRGAFVLEPTPHLEHIHAYDSEKEKTGRLLASIRVENRFGERFYIMEIYDRRFADVVSRQWGHVEDVARKRRPGGGQETRQEPLLTRR